MSAIKEPSVACICVTKNRPVYLHRSIEMFEKQSYSNRELIVVCDSNDDQSIGIAKEKNIEPLIVPHHLVLSLGEIRNLAKTAAFRADYVCQWDDDDWFHADRLDLQMKGLFEFDQSACALTNWIIFDELTGKSYLSMFRLWEGTAVYNSSHAQNVQFPKRGLGEDTIFLNAYIKQYGILPVTLPHLYIYRIHSNNSWNSSHKHFDMMIAQSQLLQDDVCDFIKGHIDSTTGYYDLCNFLKSKEVLSGFHFFKFNNLNYSNQQLIEYMNKVDKYDDEYFRSMIEV